MVVRAYFRSRHTSVLSDYTCYNHVLRRDARNVTAGLLEPSSYYAAVRDALDIVDANTEPGQLRDRLHRRWLRNEMLSRLRGKRMLDAPEAWVEQVALECQRIIQDRFAPGVAAGLPPLLRAVTYLAERGRVADLRRLARWEAGIAAHGRVDELQHVDHAITVTVAAELRSANQPVAFRSDDGRDVLVLPMEEIAPEVLDSTAQVRKARLDLVARRRETGDEIFIPTTFETERITGTTAKDTVHLVHRATATIDFGALNGGKTRAVGCSRRGSRTSVGPRTRGCRCCSSAGPTARHPGSATNGRCGTGCGRRSAGGSSADPPARVVEWRPRPIGGRLRNCVPVSEWGCG
ncbi:hypothetical protein NKG94_41650 [Micromonospora sp. M12]